MITASRVEAYAAPSPEASVVSELGQGAPVCVLDRTNYAGSLLHRVGWLAIRRPHPAELEKYGIGAYEQP